MSTPNLSNTSKSYLFQLSIPIFFSNIAIPFVGLVDTGLMGHLNSERYLAAISIATSVISLVFWSFGFLRMGTVGLVSQSLGRNNYNEIALIILRNLSIAFIIGFLILLLKNPILFFVEFFFKVSEETQQLINQYVSIRIYSAPAELTIYVLAGLFLGLQKTNVSSLLISIFCFGNAILSTILVTVYDLEILGAALGTVISAYASVIIFLIYAYLTLKDKISIRLNRSKIFNTKKLLTLFNINFDIFIRTIFLSFSFLWVTYQGSKLGENFLALNTILMQLVMMAAFFLDAYAFSTEAVVGYTIGKRSKKSFLEVVKNAFQLSFLTAIIISTLYFIFFETIISQLTDLEYLRYISLSYIVWILIIPPIASFCYQFDGIFIGASQTADMRNGTIVSVILFILSSEFLISIYGNHGLWLSLLFFMIMRSISLNYYFKNILRRF
ncbi:MAG: MATE family efflux transporter [Pelagibacteraceae bacterium]|jgi:MATE family multidrug resistance protein